MKTAYSIRYRSLFFFLLSLDTAIVLIYFASHIVANDFLKTSSSSKLIVIADVLKDRMNITSVEKESICTTKWINTSTIQFIPFAVDNFSEVNFLMPHEFFIVNESALSCIFRQQNGTQFITFVHRFGGKWLLEPYKHSLNLRCKIPEEISSDARNIIKLILDIHHNETHEIKLCRRYQIFENSMFYQTEKLQKSSMINQIISEQPSNIACCAMITSGLNHLVKLWLEYHIFMGVKHFYVYDNAPINETSLHLDFRSYILNGIITIVPWHPELFHGFRFHSRDWVKHQVWSYNDCIRRYGSKHHWMGIYDIDEFPLPLQKKTLTEILNKVPSEYCSLKMKHCFSAGNEVFPPTLALKSSKLYDFVHQHTFRENCTKGRYKKFIRPSKVYYYAVHDVALSVDKSKIYEANSTDEIRLNHYKMNFLRRKKQM